MSTRATYQINDITLYIHHDGYPEGAAHYFRLALAYKEKIPRGLAEAFIAVNDRAEITPCHDHHGDTEYRYTVNDKGITVERRRLSNDTWHPTYTGTLADFVEKN